MNTNNEEDEEITTHSGLRYKMGDFKQTKHFFVYLAYKRVFIPKEYIKSVNVVIADQEMGP